MAQVEQRTGKQLYGSYGHSGHGGGYEDCEGIDIGLLLTALLGIGVGFFTLFTKITMITGGGRRKKRDIDQVKEDIDPVSVIVGSLSDAIYGGKMLLDSMLALINSTICIVPVT